MAVEEFQFKIAKSKDLPLSWFELVLCPEKFREHLKTLETNPNGTLVPDINIDCDMLWSVHVLLITPAHSIERHLSQFMSLHSGVRTSSTVHHLVASQHQMHGLFLSLQWIQLPCN